MHMRANMICIAGGARRFLFDRGTGALFKSRVSPAARILRLLDLYINFTEMKRV